MARIYRSPEPDIDLPQCSVFTHLFSEGHSSQITAFIDAATGQTLTRGDARNMSLQLAWALKNILSQKRGDTMALLSGNSYLWPLVVFGGMAAGLCTTTVNSSYTPSELLYQLKDSGAYYIFTHPTLLKTAIETLRLMKIDEAEITKRIILVGPQSSYAGIEGDWRRLEDLLGKGQLEKEESFDGDATHETVLLCYSSGTTSRSKGVELTHQNIISIICGAKQRADFVNPRAVMLDVLPLFHIFGLVKLLFLCFTYGCPQVIMSHFDPDNFCAYIERYKVTVSLVVPPVLLIFAHHPAPEKYNMRSLKVLFSAAAPLSRDLILAVRSRMEKQGTDIRFPQGWGLTETSPTCTMHWAKDWLVKLGGVGELLPNVEARIVLNDGTDAPEGEPGEIWIKGPNVMKGYFKNPAATREAITPDGWFMTGDIGTVDKDGCFFIVDRKKELIKYKGFQGTISSLTACANIHEFDLNRLVPPADLESLLITHPKIIDAGVIGVWSDADATELPRAYVVPRGGPSSFKTVADKNEFSREIQTWVQGKVAQHKYLRGGVIVVNSIPKSAAGKILRKDLRELAKKEFNGGAVSNL